LYSLILIKGMHSVNPFYLMYYNYGNKNEIFSICNDIF
jgi:hypothetical protein